MNIFKAIKNLFSSNRLVAETPAYERPAPKPRGMAGRKVIHYWLKQQMDEYSGKGSFIVRVPKDVKIDLAQSATSSYLARRFGAGQYRTRKFESAHTVHVSPKITA